MENVKPRSRKKKPLGLKGWAAIGSGTVAAAALIAALTYLQMGRQYEKVFFPNTTINGVDASKKIRRRSKEVNCFRYRELCVVNRGKRRKHRRNKGKGYRP
uniref:hypothetical protein n=1 Tax=Clostridium sp. NkU-1 TaxID=1095009 RepID=UPI000AFADEC0